MEKRKNNPDFVFLICMFFLLLLGLIMVYSASSIWAEYKYADSIFFLKRQLLFVTVGLIMMFLVMQIDYWVWKKWAKPSIIVCFFFLILVLIPGIGKEINGSRSWIGVGAFSIQPSEFMKLSMILFLAKYISENQKYISTIKKGMVPTLAIVFLAFGLIMLQPDLGTGTVLVGTCITIIFIAGARVRHFMFLGFLGISGFVLLIISAPYRLKRITSFLNPWEDPLDSGFQIIQSLYAIGPGGLFGLGLFNSKQKYFYLPEPQTDFIFSILGEELGFIGAAFLLLLFGILFQRGIKIAIQAPDLFGTFIATGIIAMITIQVMINISVVIGLIPVTGITLPFLSYGGSSLTIMLTAVGVLLNISKFSNKT